MAKLSGKDGGRQEDEAATPAVRACVTDDLTAVARIYAHYVVHSTATFEEEPPTLEEWRRRLREIALLGLPFLVAEVDGTVLGYAYCTKWRSRPAYRHTVEDSIYVAPDAVGRGIGTALLESILTRCEALGMRQMIAVIADGEDGASVALHERHGFRYAGRLAAVGFKHGRWIDTIMMQRSLGPDVG